LKRYVASFLMLILQCCAAPAPTRYKPSGSVEQKYSADGPWKVSSLATSSACDREGNVCDIWHPVKLGTNPLKGMARGFRHPVIVFADGTLQDFLRERSKVTSSSWSSYLRHLATWGFIVIRSRDGETKRGDTVLDAAAYISALGSDRRSIFYKKIDRDKFGLTGHSQGAATTVILFSENNRVFTTFVPIETPLRAAMRIGNLAPRPGALDHVAHGSIFYIGGGKDWISPPTTNLSYYDSTSNAVEKEMGIVAMAKHGDLAGTPDCTPVAFPCSLGVYPYLGLPTAWFMWKLQGASDGYDTFHMNGHLSRSEPNWINVLTNIQ
jgi:hypothetical protein